MYLHQKISMYLLSSCCMTKHICCYVYVGNGLGTGLVWADLRVGDV